MTSRAFPCLILAVACMSCSQAEVPRIGVGVPALGVNDVLAMVTERLAQVTEAKRPAMEKWTLQGATVLKTAGRDTALRMRELDAQLPVLLISGYMEHALGDDADTAAVFSGILTKPFSWPQLSRTVATYTRSARAASSS